MKVAYFLLCSLQIDLHDSSKILKCWHLIHIAKTYNFLRIRHSYSSETVKRSKFIIQLTHTSRTFDLSMILMKYDNEYHTHDTRLNTVAIAFRMTIINLTNLTPFQH